MRSFHWLLAVVVSLGCSDDGAHATEEQVSDGSMTLDGSIGFDASTVLDSGRQTSTDGDVPDAAALADSGAPPEMDAGRRCADKQLPASIAGVEPESVSHHPPIVDANGNLYRMVESRKDDGNQPKMMKSADGGESWKEVDRKGRSNATDLEGTYQLAFGASVYFTITRDDTVWFLGFNTSDASTTPDRWLPTETVDTGLTTSGVVQYSSLSRTSDGRFWLFYSDALIEDRQQIAYRRRTGADTYGDKKKLDDAGGNWTGPRAHLGLDDVTHIFYEDHQNHRLYWRTLSAAGTLSEAKRIDLQGTSAVAVPHTNAVAYEHDGEEIMVIAFSGSDDRLKVVTITDGSVGPEEELSKDDILQDASIVTNEGAVAHLSVEGSIVHAVWTDRSSGAIRHRSRHHGEAWSSEHTLWSSEGEEALYVYCTALKTGGCSRLACTYDVGPHADDDGRIAYLETALPVQ